MWGADRCSPFFLFLWRRNTGRARFPFFVRIHLPLGSPGSSRFLVFSEYLSVSVSPPTYRYTSVRTHTRVQRPMEVPDPQQPPISGEGRKLSIRRGEERERERGLLPLLLFYPRFSPVWAYCAGSSKCSTRFFPSSMESQEAFQPDWTLRTTSKPFRLDTSTHFSSPPLRSF